MKAKTKHLTITSPNFEFDGNVTHTKCIKLMKLAKKLHLQGMPKHVQGQHTDAYLSMPEVKKFKSKGELISNYN